MFRNYLTSALRSFAKSKVFTMINILGLSLSMSVCLVLINIIYEHFTYDDFHPNGEQIYRLTHGRVGEVTGPLSEIYATTSPPMGRELMETFPFITNFTNVSNQFDGEIKSDDKILNIEGVFADERFFQVLQGYELTSGDRRTALSEPNSVVLMDNVAEKMFPDGNAIGKTILFKDETSFVVTGIMKSPDSKSHMKFDALASFKTMEILSKENDWYDPENWNNRWSFYNYIILEDPSREEEVISKMQELDAANIELDENHPGNVYQIQNVPSIVPGKLHSNELNIYMPGIALAFLGILGFIVIFTAAINYANLSVARSISRIREVGIRKVNGAYRWQIVVQFLLESVVLAFISLVGAVFIYKFLLHEFNALWIINIAELNISDNINSYLYFLVFTILLGLITGIAPSLFLSGNDVLSSIKGTFQRKVVRSGFMKYFSTKKILTGFQFGFAVFVLVSLLILRDQGRFLMDSEHGFDDDQIVYLELQTHEPDMVKTEFENIAGVEGASFTSHHPGVGTSWGTDMRRNPEDEEKTLYYFSTSEDYISTMGLNLIAGNEFTPGLNDERENEIILNETAIRSLEFESNSAAIGEEVIVNDSVRVTVIGVIEDYHWEPIMKSIRPLGLRILPDRYQFAYFKVNGYQPTIVEEFRDKWSSFDEGRDFAGGFLNEELDVFYQFMFDLSEIMSLIGVLALIITLLGLLGMVGYELKSREKEIALRKVLGASVKQLAFTMTRGHVIMIMIALLIAVPAAVTVNNLWINEMTYHAPFSAEIILSTVLLVIGLSSLAVLPQLIRSTRENPAVALKNE